MPGQLIRPPAAGRSSACRSLSSVLLPLPFGPVTSQFSPLLRVQSMSLSIRRPPRNTSTPSSEINVSGCAPVSVRVPVWADVPVSAASGGPISPLSSAFSRPRSIRSLRVTSAGSSSTRCEATTISVPAAACCSIDSSAVLDSASRPLAGSSSSSASGANARLRAIRTRRWVPRDSSKKRRSAEAASPRRSSWSRARRSCCSVRCRRGMSLRVSPERTISSARKFQPRAM